MSIIYWLFFCNSFKCIFKYSKFDLEILHVSFSTDLLLLLLFYYYYYYLKCWFELKTIKINSYFKILFITLQCWFKIKTIKIYTCHIIYLLIIYTKLFLNAQINTTNNNLRLYIYLQYVELIKCDQRTMPSFTSAGRNLLDERIWRMWKSLMRLSSFQIVLQIRLAISFGTFPFILCDTAKRFRWSISWRLKATRLEFLSLNLGWLRPTTLFLYSIGMTFISLLLLLIISSCPSTLSKPNTLSNSFAPRIDWYVDCIR